MGIDKLNITTHRIVDMEFLEKQDLYIREDEHKRGIYKYFCKLDKAELMWCPHKFSFEVNQNMPWSKIDINPKYFSSFIEMYDYICWAYNQGPIPLEDFNVTRVDICSDIEDLPMDVVHARLYANKANRRSFSMYKSQTIYIGTNPKILVYDKIAEIQTRLRKRKTLTEEDKERLNTNKLLTRFEILIRSFKGNLGDLLDNPLALVDHFDRISFYDLGNDEGVLDHGGLHFLLSKVNRKFRAEFEKYKDEPILDQIKRGYIDGVTKWLGGITRADFTEVLF